MRFWREHQEVVLLVVLPAGVAIGVAVAAVDRAAAAGSTGAVVVVIGAAAAGAVLLLLLERAPAGSASAGTGTGRRLPRWLMPVMFVGIASVPLWALLGHAAEAGVLAFGAGFLGAFSVLVAHKMRARSRADVVPLK